MKQVFLLSDDFEAKARALAVVLPCDPSGLCEVDCPLHHLRPARLLESNVHAAAKRVGQIVAAAFGMIDGVLSAAVRTTLKVAQLFHQVRLIRAENAAAIEVGQAFQIQRAFRNRRLFIAGTRKGRSGTRHPIRSARFRDRQRSANPTTKPVKALLLSPALGDSHWPISDRFRASDADIIRRFRPAARGAANATKAVA
jgi:hypothetical protein